MLTLSKRLELVQACSADPNAYACLQPGLRYFDHASGFLAYRKSLSGTVVLGDPVAEKQQAPELLGQFLKRYPNSVFCYLSDEAATTLHGVSKQRMRFVNMGFERTLTLPYQQSVPAAVQGAIKKAKKAGLTLTEQKLSELSLEETIHFQKINHEFLKLSPAGKEVGFISRSMHFAEEPDVRFFSINIAAELQPIGFCVLDPWYKNAKLEGYQLHQFRIKQTKLWGVYLSVVAMLLEKLQAEGLLHLSLGACAGINTIDNSPLPVSKSYNFCRDKTFQLAEYYHPLANLSKNKLQFAGTDLNRYLAAPHRLPILPLLRFAKANNMNFLPRWERS